MSINTPPTNQSMLWLKKLFNDDTRQLDKEFILSGYSFVQVYEMAGWLKDYFSSDDFSAEIICLAAENKALIAASLLASLDGGPTLLLPYAFSKQTLAEMQNSTGFKYAISDIERDFPAGTKVICPQPDRSALTLDTLNIDPHSELLRLFTGGSTGSPKIWSKTADNLFSEALYLAEKHKITEQDLIVATVSPYHIYGLLFSVIIPLISSASVVENIPSFPGEIINFVQDNSATILASVPVHYRILKGRKASNGSLRLAFSSAGMLDQIDNEEFCRQNNTPVIEVYGSTETGGIASRVRCNGEQAFYPFKTVDWKIIHEKLRVRSAYINSDLPRDTNGFFLANDRVESVQNNSFFLKGRSDSITKVGGKRVDLEEIRDTIKKQPEVEDCFTISLADSTGRENIIAALVQPETINSKKLRSNLASQLEPYAQPRIIKTIDRFPLTASGKHDLVAIKQLFIK